MVLPPPPEERAPQSRKPLSADALYELLRLRLEKIPDLRGRKCPISLADALMPAFAMFSLKYPSLLALRFGRCGIFTRSCSTIGPKTSPRRRWTPAKRNATALVSILGSAA